MIGEEVPALKSCFDDDNEVGIIPRALNHLFDELRMMNLEFSMRISYLELYNEELCDLLSTDDSIKIRIYDDSNKKGSVIVQGLEEIPVHSKDDVYKLLAKGQERRRTASTLMNAQSSRSHTVFSILVHIKETNNDGEEMLKIGKLNLVDLAGSENISKAGNEKGIRTRETVNINQSLLTLGRVITALVERTPHIPYRESKLTRLLQESLGGRTKTSIIATISPGHKDIEETLSTLDYAHRAKNIQNKPEINQRLTKKTVLKEYTEEIDRLKRDLIACRDKNGIYLAEDTYNDMQYKLESLTKELNDKSMLTKDLREDLSNKNRLFNEVSLNLVTKSEELKNTELDLNSNRKELQSISKMLSKIKKKYEEKIFVLDNHLITEEKLTAQANDLINVAESASTDTFLLHDSINRRKEMDKKIRTTCGEFVNKSTSHIDQVRQNVDKFIECNIYQTELITNDLLKSTERNRNSTNETILKISEMVESSSKTVDEIDHHFLMKSLPDIENWTQEEFAKNRFKILKSLEVNKKFEEDLTEKNKLLLDVIKNFQITQSDFSKKIILKFHETKDLTINFCTNLTTDLQNYSIEIESKLKTQQEELNNVYQINNKIKEKQERAITDFLKSMSSNEEEFQINNNRIVEISSKVELQAKKLNSDIKNKTKTILEYKNCWDENQIYCENIVKENKTATESSVDDSLKIIADERKLIEESIETQTIEINQLNKNLDEYQKNLKIKSQEMSQGLIDLKTKFNENLNEKETEIKSIVTIASTKQQQINSECSSLNKNSIKNLKEHSIKCREQLKEIETEIISLNSEKIKTYSSTGETPSRKEFNFNRNLAATSPHERLIKRFRLESRNVEETPTEIILEDSILNLSSDGQVFNSTPMVINDANINFLREIQTPEILKTSNNFMKSESKIPSRNQYETDKVRASGKKLTFSAYNKTSRNMIAKRKRTE